MYRYNGPSMNPTLRAGDILEVLPYGKNPVSIGDVVVFRYQPEEELIVHRVTALTPEGITTRGDNNPGPDLLPLRPEDICGRVVSAQGKTGKRSIPSGRRGQYLALYLRLRKKVLANAAKLLHAPYHLLAKTKIFRYLLPFFPKICVHTFRRPDGIELQLFMGRKLIGRYRPGHGQWQIMRPYRLFVDEVFLDEISGS